MITGPIIAEIAALVGDPARATMVSALLDGRALAASELAVAARITPQTASTHLEKRPRYRPLSQQARALSAARICYDHLAGRLSVDLTDSLVARKYVVLDDNTAEITTAGIRFFTRFGIELPTPRLTRRHVSRLCLDWTERRPHIAGAVGAAITRRCFDLGWMERMKRSHAVIVTPVGRQGFQERFGIAAS